MHPVKGEGTSKTKQLPCLNVLLRYAPPHFALSYAYFSHFVIINQTFYKLYSKLNYATATVKG